MIPLITQQEFTSALCILLGCLFLFAMFRSRWVSKKALNKLKKIGSEANKTVEKSGTHLPVKHHSYDTFFLLECQDKSTVIEQLTALGALDLGDISELIKGEDYQLLPFEICQKGKWILVKNSPKLDFYQFHNAQSWMLDHKRIERCYGVALHRERSSESYYVHLDHDNSYGDTNIGRFEDGRNFFVYQPEAYEDDGNIKVSEDVEVHFKSIDQLFQFTGFPQESLTSCHGSSHSIAFVM